MQLFTSFLRTLTASLFARPTNAAHVTLQPVSHTEFYDDRLMTQEIEALTLISSTQETPVVPALNNDRPT